jgi:hypothetical protein
MSAWNEAEGWPTNGVEFEIAPYRPKNNANSRFATREFVAWDGEGVSYGGRHHYIMLGNSKGNFLRDGGSVCPRGLATTESIEFLLEQGSQYPNAYHVIFAGGYDANKILKDLASSENRLQKLWETSQTFYKQYHIEWVRGKWLKLRCLKTNRRITLFDVFSFFQTSFVKTLKSWDIWSDDLETIAQMKEQRGQFKWEDREEIEHYCRMELTALVQLMDKFRVNHIKAGLPALSGLYGPGAIANSLLKLWNIPKFMVATDTEINLASRYAYGAGRIERLRYGNYEGPTKILDLNAAYPAIISELPALNNGWRHYSQTQTLDTHMEEIEMSLYHVRLYNHDEYTSPLLYRKPGAKHKPIFFPNPKGNDYIDTWVWTPEYELLKDFPHETLEAYIFNGSNVRPFAALADIYYSRLEDKRNGNPAEKNKKLALASIYGKQVQQAGYEREEKIPKYHQLEWGGYTTSGTRARLFAAMYEIKFRDIVGVETDSIILASSNIPNSLPYSDALGEWGVTDYDGITYVQSGVYWLKKEGEWRDLYSKRRGYLPGTLEREMVIDAWNSNPCGDDTIQNSDGHAIGVTVNARGKTFITLGHCFRPGQSIERWGEWEEGPKLLRLWRTNKRAIERTGNPARQLLDTTDQTRFSGKSAPYDLIWSDI